MKRELMGFALAVGLFSAVPDNASAEDISNHWAYHEMNDLIENGYMKGDALGNYNPDANVTRAEFATFLVRVLELPQASTKTNFLDVKEGDWYYDVVNQAASAGLIQGDDSGRFKPNDPITRQEMAVMMKRALDYRGETPPELTYLYFNDTNQIADWAYDQVQYVVSAKLILGDEKKNFRPLSHATRGETAVVLYRMLHPEEVPETPVVSPIEYTTVNYEQNFSSALDAQAANQPKVDGAGVFTASEEMVSYYMNPNNFQSNQPEFYQFLKLSTPIQNLSEEAVNDKILYNKGVFQNTADAFIQAGRDFEINAIYLISHALHETGNGTSHLATGIEVGKDEHDNLVVVTDDNRDTLTNIKTTYNVYGIGAIDANADKYGAIRAYEEGWFTVTEAIIGGAQFVKERYIDVGQDTLYKMRWNPDRPAYHQYATHVMWATIQARKIYELYEAIDADKNTNLVFQVPKYKAQPTAGSLPSMENQFAVLDSKYSGKKGKTIEEDVHVRTYPFNYPYASTPNNSIMTLPKGTEFTILGENGGWYKISVNGQEGWIIDDYVAPVEPATAFLNIYGTNFAALSTTSTTTKESNDTFATDKIDENTSTADNNALAENKNSNALTDDVSSNALLEDENNHSLASDTNNDTLTSDENNNTLATDKNTVTGDTSNNSLTNN